MRFNIRICGSIAVPATTFIGIFLFFLKSVLGVNECRLNTSAPCVHFYPEEYLHDVYYSGLRLRTKKAHTVACKREIEYSYMDFMRRLAEESPMPFEDIFYYSQCKAKQSIPAPNPVTKKATLLKVSEENPPQRMSERLKARMKELNVTESSGTQTTITTTQAGLSANVSVPTSPSYSISSASNKMNAPPLNADDLAILYVMLVHMEPQFVLRIICALSEPQHHFVIHIDSHADPSVEAMLRETLNPSFYPNVHILDDSHRERITWGAFSIVNATLAGLRYAWKKELYFDYAIDLSGTSYPVKSNKFIRSTLARDRDAVFMDVHDSPARPEPQLFNYYVECDGALHRIYRMPLIRGINMYIGSQWFALPRHVVHWILESQLSRQYIEYAKHIIIADENFFATMFKNSPYCEDKVHRNLLFVLFDRWENERANNATAAALPAMPTAQPSNSTDSLQLSNASMPTALAKLKDEARGRNVSLAATGQQQQQTLVKPRDNRKCLVVDPDQCGRSPTTLTMEYKHLIVASRSLFARKFNPQDPSSAALLDFIDTMRNGRGSTQNGSSDSWDHNTVPGMGAGAGAEAAASAADGTVPLVTLPTSVFTMLKLDHRYIRTLENATTHSPRKPKPADRTAGRDGDVRGESAGTLTREAAAATNLAVENQKGSGDGGGAARDMDSNVVTADAESSSSCSSSSSSSSSSSRSSNISSSNCSSSISSRDEGGQAAGCEGEKGGGSNSSIIGNTKSLFHKDVGAGRSNGAVESAAHNSEENSENTVGEGVAKEGLEDEPLDESAQLEEEEEEPDESEIDLRYADYCVQYTNRQQLIHLAKCDAANSGQWFRIVCSEGYELTIDEGDCPLIRPAAGSSPSFLNPPNKPEISSNNNSSSGNSGNSGGIASSYTEAYCSVFVSDHSGGDCLDIAGENPSPGTPLLGYECTGRWNQLFQLRPDCSISATQPDVIGRVRGFPGDRTVCLDASKGPAKPLATAPCLSLTETYLLPPISAFAHTPNDANSPKTTKATDVAQMGAAGDEGGGVIDSGRDRDGVVVSAPATALGMERGATPQSLLQMEAAVDLHGEPVQADTGAGPAAEGSSRKGTKVTNRRKSRVKSPVTAAFETRFRGNIFQRFQFLTSAGEAYKKYLSS